MVTGASGFLGQALINLLQREKIPVIGVSRRRSPGLTRVTDYSETPVSSGGVLVHLAQSRSPTLSDESEIDLCRAIIDNPWRHVIYASSAMVYGDDEVYPRRTDEPLLPHSDYARVKLACESMVNEAGGTNIRFANIYGPGMAETSIIADIIRQIPGRAPLQLRDQSAVRDFVWIGDAVSCLAAACRFTPPGTFNAGSGRSVAAGEVARLALSLANEGSREVVSTKPTNRRSTLALDISTSRTILRWWPKTELQTGLAALMSA